MPIKRLALPFMIGAAVSAAAQTDADFRLHELISRPLRGGSKAIPAYISDIRATVKDGADPNLALNGKTPMDLADEISWDWQQANARQELTLAGAKASPEQAQHMLMFAVVYGYPPFVKQALACGAKPDAFIEGESDIYWHCCGYSYLYTLLRGFECHYDGEPTECLQQMLNAGANPNIRNRKDGMVPLLCYRCTPEHVALLLAHGADANATDAEGHNVLMLRFRYQFPHRCEELISILTAAGLNLNHRDSQGRTVMDYALVIQNAALQSKSEHPDTRKRNAAIIAQLRALGAKTAAELQ